MNKFFGRFVAIGTILLLFAETGFALNCQQVKLLTGVYFKMHFSQHSFDNELSEKTLDSFIKSWDPGKIYFLQADIDNFKEKYSTKLDDMIQKDDCSVIDSVVDVYSKRFQERQKTIAKFIDSNFDFTKDEYMNIDRKKMKWAKTVEEVENRWRKRIKFSTMQLNDTVKDIAKVREKLKKRYALALKRHNDMTSDDAYTSFLNAFSNSLDPHSTYLDAETLEDFRISTRLSLEGIGAVLRSEDGFTTIQSLVPGGAAAKTKKVKADDKIIAVAQGEEPPADVIDMDLREVVKLIRGTGGTEVRLTLVREVAGKTKQVIVPIIREKIQLEDRAANSYVHEVDMDLKGKKTKLKIGVIDLPSFYMDFEGRQNRETNFKSSSADMKREILALKKQNVDGIIVDLRSNGGGALDESITIAGLFFDEGPVVQIKDKRGTIYVQKDEDEKTYYSGPLVVMIDRQSASASEIFAGAIQDYKRGLIVGDSHTFGKGTVQNLNDIDEKLGAIKVTISKFYRPSGASTQLKGVASDIKLPSILDEYDVGEKFYDYALPWEKIKSSKYKEDDVVTKYVASLDKLSKDRIEKNKDYDDIREAIAKFKKSEDERSRVSLKKEDKKSAKDLAAEEEEDELDSREHNLAKDLNLQETLRITADYVQLLKKQPTGIIDLPDVKKMDIADTAKNKKEVKATP